MDRNRSVAGIICVCVLSVITVSCAARPSRIQPIEAVLGTGWTCYAAPDVFKKAGIVIEATADRKYLFDSDYSAKAIEGPSAIGTATVTSSTTVGGVVQLLKNFQVFTKDANITADLSRKVTIDATYGGTRKQVVSGDGVRDIANAYSKIKLTPTSHYFVFRESHTATSIDILVDRSVAASVNATATLDGMVNVNPKISRNNAGKYRLKDQYDVPVGICTIATELLIERSFDGTTNVRPGQDYRVPDNVTVERKGP